MTLTREGLEEALKLAGAAREFMDAEVEIPEEISGPLVEAVPAMALVRTDGLGDAARAVRGPVGEHGGSVGMGLRRARLADGDRGGGQPEDPSRSDDGRGNRWRVRTRGERDAMTGGNVFGADAPSWSVTSKARSWTREPR